MVKNGQKHEKSLKKKKWERGKIFIKFEKNPKNSKKSEKKCKICKKTEKTWNL